MEPLSLSNLNGRDGNQVHKICPLPQYFQQNNVLEVASVTLTKPLSWLQTIARTTIKLENLSKISLERAILTARTLIYADKLTL